MVVAILSLPVAGARGQTLTPMRILDRAPKSKIQALPAAIGGITAQRVGRTKIHIVGKVQNNLVVELPNIGWTVVCWDGVHWKNVKSGNVSLGLLRKSNVEFDLTAKDMPQSNFNADLRFKFEVSPSEQGSLLSNNVGKLSFFVVKYSSQRTAAREFDNVDSARDMAKSLRDLGFTTEIRYTENKILGQTTSKTYTTFYATNGWQEVVKETPKAAKEFRSRLEAFMSELGWQQRLHLIVQEEQR
jgi:hypothetical protein